MDRAILKIKDKINSLLSEKGHVIVAIDGNCGSGKSTLAGELARLCRCNLFHMDDYFLTPDMRTPKRMSEIGGNTDHERFSEEVLKPLSRKKAVDYTRYDCATQSFSPPKRFEYTPVSIVEGSYSMHPANIAYYDLKIMIKITPPLQSRRLLARSGAYMHQRYINEWIPRENEYFDHFKIEDKCDIVLIAEEIDKNKGDKFDKKENDS